MDINLPVMTGFIGASNSRDVQSTDYFPFVAQYADGYGDVDEYGRG